MPTTSILWRRLDQPGHESALLSEGTAGAVLSGVAVFSELAKPCLLDYRIVCDAAWRTVSVRVTGSVDTTPIGIAIDVDPAREWAFSGRPCPEVLGCEDIDLSFSPATNLLAIRRLQLAVGARAPVRAAWLRFPGMTLAVLEQSYERLSASRYRYESGHGSFAATLETNAAGFVTQYPGLWEEER